MWQVFPAGPWRIGHIAATNETEGYYLLAWCDSRHASRRSSLAAMSDRDVFSTVRDTLGITGADPGRDQRPHPGVRPRPPHPGDMTDNLGDPPGAFVLCNGGLAGKARDPKTRPGL